MTWQETDKSLYIKIAGNVSHELTGSRDWWFANMDKQDIDEDGAWLELQGASIFLPFDVTK